MNTLSEKPEYGNPRRHHLQYCGKRFKFHGKTITYLYADYGFINGVYQRTIIFTDGISRDERGEEEFFNEVEL